MLSSLTLQHSFIFHQQIVTEGLLCAGSVLALTLQRSSQGTLPVLIPFVLCELRNSPWGEGDGLHENLSRYHLRSPATQCGICVTALSGRTNVSLTCRLRSYKKALAVLGEPLPSLSLHNQAEGKQALDSPRHSRTEAPSRPRAALYTAWVWASQECTVGGKHKNIQKEMRPGLQPFRAWRNHVTMKTKCILIMIHFTKCNKVSSGT